MLVLGLQGSPRKKGNTEFLLSAFMDEAQRLGARTHIVDVCAKRIEPCRELIVCEKKGFCPIDDDMKHEIYPLLREADVIVMASPIFFYNVTSQLKALIDRSQTLWARKYKLRLQDPARHYRKGFVLALGATRGKSLFDGLHLTAKYFFDAVGAVGAGSLTYRKIEGRGDMAKHPGVAADIQSAVSGLIGPLAGRTKILFACRENACCSQMAGAFAQMTAGERFDVLTAGSQPADRIHPDMEAAMAEKGIDMGFRIPRNLDEVLAVSPPEIIVTMGGKEACPIVPGARRLDWDLPDPAGQPMAIMRQVRDDIETRVKALVADL
jgi:arsenate reductase